MIDNTHVDGKYFIHTHIYTHNVNNKKNFNKLVKKVF